MKKYASMKRFQLFFFLFLLISYKLASQDVNLDDKAFNELEIRFLEEPLTEGSSDVIEKLRWFYVGKISTANQKKDWDMLKEWALRGLIFIEIAEPDSTQHAHFHSNAGKAFYNLNQKRESIVHYESAAVIYKNILQKESGPVTRQVLEKYLKLAFLGAARSHYYLEEYAKADSYDIVLYDVLNTEISSPMVYWPDELYLVYESIQMNLSNADYATSLAKSIEGLDMAEGIFGLGHLAYAQFLYYKGLSNVLLGNYDKGIEDYLGALKMAASKYKNSGFYLSILSRLANAHKANGNFELALKYYEEYFRNASDQDPFFISTSVQYGDYFVQMGEYRSANNYLNSLLKRIQNTYGPDRALEFNTLLSLGVTHQRLENYDSSEYYYAEAKVKAINDERLAIVKNNLGLLYTETGSYIRAEKNLNESIKHYQSLDETNSIQYANSLNNLASLYEKIGNYEEAGALYEEALTIIQNVFGKANHRYGELINNLAGLHFKQKNFHLADSLYRNALAIFESTMGKSHINYSLILFNVAKIARELNHPDEAKEMLAFVQKSIDNNDQHHSKLQANVYAVLGLVEMDANKYQRAIDYFEKSLAIFELTKDNSESLKLNSYLGLCLLSIGDYQNASPYYEKFRQSLYMEIQEAFPYMTEYQKASFVATIKETFDPFISFAIQHSFQNPSVLKELLDFRIATKGLIFKSINRTRDLVLGSGDTSLMTSYTELQKLKSQISEFENQDSESLKNQGISLEYLNRTATQLEKTIVSSAKSFSHIVTEDRNSFKTVKSKLKSGEAAVEIIRFNWYNRNWTDSVFYSALIITPDADAPQVVLIKNGNDLEGKYLKRYRSAVQYKLEDVESYIQFWSPIKEVIGSYKTIYFSPDGVYNLINLNTLKDPLSGEFLIDQLDIHYVLDVSNKIGANSSKLNSSRNLALIGFPDYDRSVKTLEVDINRSSGSADQRFADNFQIAPLPGTQVEIEQIAKILSKQKIPYQLYTGAQASERVVKNLIDPYVIHIATHGFFIKNDGSILKGSDVDSPMNRSGLFLAGSQSTIAHRNSGNLVSGDDGIFTAFEAGSLVLNNTELVVLSACETGLGDVSIGEGIYGLQRSIFTAGVKNIIMSLWKVSDKATQALMTEFYTLW